MSSTPETHHFPSVQLIDGDYSAFAHTVESSPLQTWSHHKYTQSFDYIDAIVWDGRDVYLDEKNGKDTLQERIHFNDGVTIGLELGKRVLGRGFDNHLNEHILKANATTRKDPILERNYTTMFDKLQAIGSVSSWMMPRISDALRTTGETSQLGESRIKALQAGMGYVADTIVNAQMLTKANFNLMSYHYGNPGFDEQQLEELYK